MLSRLKEGPGLRFTERRRLLRPTDPIRVVNVAKREGGTQLREVSVAIVGAGGGGSGEALGTWIRSRER